MNVISPLLIRNSDVVKRYIDSLLDVADVAEGQLCAFEIHACLIISYKGDMTDVLEESSAIPSERAILDGVFPCREDSFVMIRFTRRSSVIHLIPQPIINFHPSRSSTSFKKADLSLTNYTLKYTRPHESPVIIPMRTFDASTHFCLA